MRLTKEDAKIIRNKARQLAGALRVRLEVGIFTGKACPEGTINQEVFGIEAYHTTNKISDLDDYMDWWIGHLLGKRISRTSPLISTFLPLATMVN